MNRKTTLHYAFFALSLTYAWVMVGTYAPHSTQNLAGWLTPDDDVDWVTIDEAKVASGATVPAHQNVLFYIPPEVNRIYRRVLFGEKSKSVRYWGYCFPDESEPRVVEEGKLPGKVFLSEEERAVRAERERLNKPAFSIYTAPSRSELDRRRTMEPIRHQMEVFRGGMVCYIMTDKPLPIGLDPDGDDLNSQSERTFGTDPKKQDTDGDGITDGQEVLSLGSNPKIRDTDGDGIIDGIEDRNRNGRQEMGESNATKWDTDGDRLCDGFCRMTGSKKLCRDLSGKDCIELPFNRWAGEDKDLDGLLDKDETSPIEPDTDGDKILDEQEYYNCLLKGEKNC